MVAMLVRSGPSAAPMVEVDMPAIVWQPEHPLVIKMSLPGSGAGVSTKVGPTAKVGSRPRGGGVGVGLAQANSRKIGAKKAIDFIGKLPHLTASALLERVAALRCFLYICRHQIG